MGIANPFHEFVDLVAKMRKAQTAYFWTTAKTKQKLDFVIKLEKDVDGAIAAIRRPMYGDRMLETTTEEQSP